MTAIKLDGKLASNAIEALAPLAGSLYASPGTRRWAVVELAHVERTQPAPDEDKEASVKLRITHLEVANADQEETLRRAHQALHLHRTAYGTLNEEQELELAKSTLADTGGELSFIEAARLRALIEHWTAYIRRTQNSAKLTNAERKAEIDKAVRAMRDAIQVGATGDPE